MVKYLTIFLDAEFWYPRQSCIEINELNMELNETEEIKMAVQTT